MQHLGCSDGEYESDFSSQGEDSQFSSTPNTSVESKPNSTPAKIAQPLSLKGSQIVSRGKDMSLIMKPGQKYDTPVQSLYFREMAPKNDSKAQPKEERSIWENTEGSDSSQTTNEEIQEISAEN